MLYKYRPLSNFEYLVDALVNRRLYAAAFTALNDPMEGAFRASHKVSDQQLRAIAARKGGLRVLSLSKEVNNSLMWSYYAQSHQGVALGVRLDLKSDRARTVEYVDDFDIDVESPNLPVTLLTRKFGPWRHESEVRVLTISPREHVPVTVAQVVFGLATPLHYQELITSIAAQFNPGVKITKMTERKLNKGKFYYRPTPNE